MALSSSKNYTDTFTAANIIALALRRLGVLDPSETVNTTEEANALVVLNLMVKEMCSLGLDNWLRQTGVLWVTAPGDKNKYTLGPSGSPAATSWAETELAVTASAATTTITVASLNATHTISSANIGVRLDDGDIFFTTISGAPSGSTVTLASGLPSVASVGNRIYTYATSYQINRPSRILYASRITHDTTNTSVASEEVEGIESEINIIGMDEYRTLAQKKQVGATLSIYYEPTITNGTLYIWPTGSTNQDYDKINLVYNFYVDDFDLTTNNAQFPPEWHNALAWSLAAELAAEYGLAEPEQKRLWSVANSKLAQLLDYDLENASVIFARDVRP